MMREPRPQGAMEMSPIREHASRKAQLWSFDLAVSMVIFLTVLVLVLFFWSYGNVQSFEQLNTDRAQDRAIAISDTLVRSKGVPEHWTAATVRIVGLAQEEKVLNETKVQQFLGLDYTTARDLLDTAGYDFSFELLYTNNTAVQMNGTNASLGSVASNATAIIPVERYVLFRSTITRARLTLWTA